MKIIQSFFLLTVGFCATTIVYAQELKPEIAKPIEVKILPAAIDTKPSPVSELKPQPGPDPKETASSAVAETPSPLKKDENIKPNENSSSFPNFDDSNFYGYISFQEISNKLLFKTKSI